MSEAYSRPAAGYDSRLSVAIYVENELLRLGLQAMLPASELVEDATLYDSPSAVLEALSEEKVDVLIVSSSNGSKPHSDASFRLGRSVRLLVLLDSSENEAMTPMMANPADGYLKREELTARTLDRALLRLVAGEMVIPLHLGRQLLNDAVRSTRDPAFQAVRLTTREQEILGHLVAGLSNREIARQIHISEHGVKRLVSSVLLKLQAPNRTGAVVTAIKLGLVDC
ncbi:response regulator transcription factor [Streptomyces sp. Wh19]|uniref:response regulator transcription factor n=1 Tax=Streptomyces sp. Wh19 TaxID=3076629 RepID=UPI002958D821|nr:response regulator transcription factor [Streptomyces sp. Wh19]MDV9194468.1 response regulator transcription factor [Streptomyces sp. Wh19]